MTFEFSWTLDWGRPTSRTCLSKLCDTNSKQTMFSLHNLDTYQGKHYHLVTWNFLLENSRSCKLRYPYPEKQKRPNVILQQHGTMAGRSFFAKPNRITLFGDGSFGFNAVISKTKFNKFHWKSSNFFSARIRKFQNSRTAVVTAKNKNFVV